MTTEPKTFPTIYATTDSPPDYIERLRAAAGLTIGDRVRVLAGFEKGMEGVIVANEPDRSRDNPYGTDRPFRFRIRFEPCPYCGAGMCRGSARTAKGRDVDAWAAAHTSKKPTPGTIGGFAPFDLEPVEVTP